MSGFYPNASPGRWYVSVDKQVFRIRDRDGVPLAEVHGDNALRSGLAVSNASLMAMAPQFHQMLVELQAAGVIARDSTNPTAARAWLLVEAFAGTVKLIEKLRAFQGDRA